MNETNPGDFKATVEVFERLSFCASGISSETQGLPTTWEGVLASIAFSKLAITSTSILKLVPGSKLCSEVFGVQMWDLGSICALSRNLVEIGLTMHYFLQPRLDESERKLRRQVWEYHDQLERLKIMRAGAPHNKKPDPMEKKVQQKRADLLASTRFQQLPSELRRRILRGERAKLLTNEEICRLADISPNFYSAMFKYGSNHTHASPFSFSLMDRLSPSADLGLDAVNIALTVGTGFLAIGIRDYIHFVPGQLERLTVDERRQIQIWLGVVKWDQNSFFGKLED